MVLASVCHWGGRYDRTALTLSNVPICIGRQRTNTHVITFHLQPYSLNSHEITMKNLHYISRLTEFWKWHFSCVHMARVREDRVSVEWVCKWVSIWQPTGKEEALTLCECLRYRSAWNAVDIKKRRKNSYLILSLRRWRRNDVDFYGYCRAVDFCPFVAVSIVVERRSPGT